MWKSSSLSLVQKAHVINMLCFSKISYLGSFLDVPKHILQKIDKVFFQFLWNGKTEMIKRSTLLLNIQLGGIGLFHLENKLKSFRLSHVKQILFGNHSKYKALSTYWIGYSLGNFNQIFRSNLIPHSFSRPSFYQQINTLLNMVKSEVPDLEWEKAKNIHFYRIVSSKNLSLPTVVSKHPTINLKSADVFPLEKDIIYRIAHDALPINVNYNISKTSKCILCPQDETIIHLFATCLVLKPL